MLSYLKKLFASKAGNPNATDYDTLSEEKKRLQQKLRQLNSIKEELNNIKNDANTKTK